MSQSWLLMTVFSKLLELTEILIWEVKISIKEFWTTSWKWSRRKITLIFLRTREPSKNLKEKSKREKELCLLNTKPKSKLKIWLKAMTSLKLLPELNSKNLTLIFSRKLYNHLNWPWKELIWRRMKLMKSFWSEVQPEFQRSDNSLKNGSMVKNQTPVSTLMKPSVMVLPFKEVLFADKKVEMISSLSMPPLSH